MPVSPLGPISDPLFPVNGAVLFPGSPGGPGGPLNPLSPGGPFTAIP
jgi:hypothetical protein